MRIRSTTSSSSFSIPNLARSGLKETLVQSEPESKSPSSSSESENSSDFFFFLVFLTMGLISGAPITLMFFLNTCL